MSADNVVRHADEMILRREVAKSYVEGMDGIPAISTSALTGLQNGTALLESGTAELINVGMSDPTSQDTLDLRSAGSVGSVSSFSGIRDLFLARLEVGAGALLVHAFRDNRQSLFEMLRG